MKQIISLEQNSPEWEAWRFGVFGASDAAAMLDISPYKSRSQLLREKIMGVRPAPSSFQAELFAQGHAAEKAAIALLEAELEQIIMPIIIVIDDGIAASLDGLTADGKLLIEHKLYRESGASQERFSLAQTGELPEYDMAQVQQQLMVSGAEKAWFVVSDGTAENRAIAQVLPDEYWFECLKQGWRSFAVALEASQDRRTEMLAESYRSLENDIKLLEAEKEQLRKQLIETAQQTGGTLVCKGLTVKQIESKGAVDYKAISALQGVDLEQYRKANTSSWRISLS